MSTRACCRSPRQMRLTNRLAVIGARVIPICHRHRGLNQKGKLQIQFKGVYISTVQSSSWLAFPAIVPGGIDSRRG
ncbi:hypothetical protein VTN96DRAFT_8770 [Rasamsonia emersonii]